MYLKSVENSQPLPDLVLALCAPSMENLRHGFLSVKVALQRKARGNRRHLPWKDRANTW